MSNDRALPLLEDGSTLSALRVDGLRALRMKKPVELRRLMLLVGRNGIGKSTFARVFPLLRQSAQDKKREPLLWWEQDEVDFGSFSEAVRRGADRITLSFEFTGKDETKSTVSTVLIASDNVSRIEQVQFLEAENRLTLHYGPNGRPVRLEGSAEGFDFVVGEEPAPPWLLPSFDVDKNTLFGFPPRFRTSFFTKLAQSSLDGSSPDIDNHVLEEATLILRRYLRRRRIEQLIQILKRKTPTAASRLGGADQRIPTLLRQATEEPSFKQRLRLVTFCEDTLNDLSIAEDLIDQVAIRTAYIGPFRAVPERTYRPQGVAIEELDPGGANLTMFLSALTFEERDDLDAYLRESLGFAIKLEQVGGHYALQVVLDDTSYNLLDVGFGYSQMLPVAVQLWASSRVLSTSREKISHSTIVIEQPELHLHPHQQVLMARALGKLAAADEGPVQIIETHSDHLVGEIGMMVAHGQLPRERVGVLYFEPHPESGTSVRMATFDDDGVLQNWPAGFLSP